MTSIFVTLESSAAIATNSSYSSDDFTTEYYQSIVLPADDNTLWGVGLYRAAIWNTIPNVSATSYNNNAFSYSPDGGVTTVNVVIPEGTYSYEDINNYLHQVMFDNGDFGGTALNPIYAITLVPNYQTLRVEFVITAPPTGDPNPGPYEVTLVNNFADFIGFTPQVLSGPGTYTGTFAPDVTSGVNQVSINLDVIKASAAFGPNGKSAQILYVYTPDVPPGGLIDLNPNNPVFLEVDARQIKKIRCYFLDSQGREVDFRGEDNTITLEFKKFKRI